MKIKIESKRPIRRKFENVKVYFGNRIEHVSQLDGFEKYGYGWSVAVYVGAIVVGILQQHAEGWILTFCFGQYIKSDYTPQAVWIRGDRLVSLDEAKDAAEKVVKEAFLNTFTGEVDYIEIVRYPLQPELYPNCDELQDVIIAGAVVGRRDSPYIGCNTRYKVSIGSGVQIDRMWDSGRKCSRSYNYEDKVAREVWTHFQKFWKVPKTSLLYTDYGTKLFPNYAMLDKQERDI
jgi:hypothetical protein